MKVTITEIFCEVLTGLVFALVALAYTDRFDLLSFSDVFGYLRAASPAEGFLSLAVLAYLLGVVLDACGLVFDDALATRLVASNSPTPEHRRSFWRHVSSQTLAYRDHVWTYYFCYRNLALLALPGAIGYFLLFHSHGWTSLAIVSAVLWVAFGAIMYLAIRPLLRLYNSITSSYVDS